MTYYIFVFNGLDCHITGPFANEELAMAKELQISLSSTHVAMVNSPTLLLSNLTEFTPWSQWPKRYPEFYIER